MIGGCVRANQSPRLIGGWLLLLLLLCFDLAACSSPSNVSSTDVTRPLPPWTEPLSADSSDFQQEVLAEYQVTGEVSYDNYRTSVYDALACMNDAGLQTFSEETTILGLAEVNYSVKVPKDLILDDGSSPEVDAIFVGCTHKYSEFTTELYRFLYQAQAQEELFGPFREAIIQCLETNGHDIPDDATFDEIESEVLSLMGIDGNLDGPDCYQLTGYADLIGADSIVPNG